MRLFLLLIGFICSMLGPILSYRFDFTIGLIVLFFGVFALWSMLPSTDENERLRRYEW